MIRAPHIYRSSNIHQPIMRLADISYRPSSIDSAIDKNVLFAILLINARFFGAYGCAHIQARKDDLK